MVLGETPSVETAKGRHIDKEIADAVRLLPRRLGPHLGHPYTALSPIRLLSGLFKLSTPSVRHVS